MYDELIKNLRGRSQFLLPHYGEETSYDSDLMKQAADAIEDLIAALTASNEVIAKNKPRWIPVTERLPEKMQYVLVRYQNNDMAVASWFGGDEHIRFWRAMTDEGWCADCDTEPTHWMPLPQPPKEE